MADEKMRKPLHVYISEDGFHSIYEDGTEVFGAESGCLAGPRRVIASDVSPEYSHLIAAAPQLYEALKYLLKSREIECEHMHPGPDEYCAKCRADAALSAALGGK